MRQRSQRDYYTMGQIAKMFQVCPQTIAKWCNLGKLKCHRLLAGEGKSGERRVTRLDLVEFIKTNNLPMPEELERASSLPYVVLFNLSGQWGYKVPPDDLFPRVEIIYSPIAFGAFIESAADNSISHCIMGDSEGSTLTFQATQELLYRQPKAEIYWLLGPDWKLPRNKVMFDYCGTRVVNVYQQPIPWELMIGKLVSEYKNLTQSKNLQYSPPNLDSITVPPDAVPPDMIPEDATC